MPPRPEWCRPGYTCKMSEKRYFTYNEIHRTVAGLAREIQASGFAPDVTVAIGTGGFIPARILKTFLKKPILTVGVKLYNDDNSMGDGPEKVQWIDEVERKLRGRKVLLIDEVDDSRTTLAYCLRELLSHEPAEIGVAVLHCKDKPKQAQFPPEVRRYWVGQHLPDIWVVYPWDAEDIDQHDAGR
jgi:hypoxanthine phosphoribosyltransferase